MIFMWENRFNERIDSPLFLDHWKRLKKFQIFVTMGQLSILGKNVGINGDAIDCDI